MTIHAKAVDTEYVCIVATFEMIPSIKEFVGKVGLMRAAHDDDTFRFVTIHDEPKAFPKENVFVISKKEYFKGKLSG